MISNKRNLLILLVSMAMITIILSGLIEAESNEKQLNSKSKSSISSKLERLLDWNTYMMRFKKKYSSTVQQLLRQKIFMARAVDVFKTSVKYMVYMISYYTSINKFSDMTYSEAKRIISGDKSSPKPDEFTDDSVATKLLIESLNDEDINDEKDIDDILKFEKVNAIEQFKKNYYNNKDKNKNKNKNNKRKKRSLFGYERRKFDPNNLIKTDEYNTDTIVNNDKVQFIIPSNNPHYQEVFVPNPEPNPSQHREVRIVDDIPPEDVKNIGGFLNQGLFIIKASLNSLIKETSDEINTSVELKSDDDNNDKQEKIKKAYTQKNTIILRDWTDSGCIGPIRNQEICNSCYAMSSTSYMEWSLCMNQNKVLTPLSPQYTVSCGLQFSEESNWQMNLKGCDYGSSKQTFDFIREYGLELEANMEYIDNETNCPYRFRSPRKIKGFIRPNVNEPIRLNPKTNRLDLALKVGPVIVSMKVPKDFVHYAGGILDYCDTDSGHSMLIVGIGIEDDVEYLIIKNSYGTGWGYSGYLKFKRSEAWKCVKEYISPSINFPSGKSKARRIKAYLANKETMAKKIDIDDESSNEINLETYTKNYSFNIGEGEIQRLEES